MTIPKKLFITGFICLIALLSVWVKEYMPLQAFRPASAAVSEPGWYPVLLIDPGHGGTDGGAVSRDGTIESTLNLAIAQKLNGIASFYGIPTVMTRNSEEIQYPDTADTISAKKKYDQQQRAAMIAQYPNGILISIHQNFYPDARPKGAQVLYGHTAESEQFGKLIHSNLMVCLNPENRRVAAPIDASIYLLRHAECTAVLVECGFLSNTEETAQLKTQEYQKELATVLAASYLEYIQQEM